MKQVENLYTENCIRTRSGIYFNVVEPTLDMINIEDIAHSLSMMPRFGGHLPNFYSVAQHSISVYSRCGNENKLAGLMHDASEAYLMDLPSPIKNLMPEYKIMENKIMSLIQKKYSFQITDQVKRIDAEVLELEWNYIILSQVAICYTQQEMKDLFLEIFYSLTK